MDTVRETIINYVVSHVTGYDDLTGLCRLWDEKHAEYLEGERQYAAGRAKYNQGLATYQTMLQKFKDGHAQYMEGRDMFYAGVSEYERGAVALEAAKREMRDKLRQLDDGESQYAEGKQKYEDGVRQRDEAAQKADELPESRWILMDCRGNSSFVQLLLGSSNLSSIEMTFSLMFMLVGALVIYATIGKMIDEQRNLVGAGKAFGLYNREIFAKYLLFGLSATVLGTVFGILAARFLMEVHVLKTAKPYYNFDTTRPALIVKPTLVVIGAGVLLSLAAIRFACKKLLRSTAIQLMSAQVPAGRKKTGRAKGHVLSLYSRLILLNIRTDIKRVIVTIVSVAGCCALVVIGFTLKSAVEGALEKQYGRIVDYDGRIRYDAQTAEGAGDAIRERLDRNGVAYTRLYDDVVTFRVRDNLVGELLCGDIDQIGSFYHLLDWVTGEPVASTDEGILVQKRTAESYDLKIGSELELMLSNAQTAKVRVAGIFDNYIGRVMLMSRSCYRTLFGADCVDNTFYVRLDGVDEAALTDSIKDIEGYEAYTRADADKALFASSASMVNAIVALFIFMAAVMAGVVLTNLTNIYIMQKKRELTIMRVNGFTVREVIGYVSRETVVTTVLGILIGIGMGALIAYRITRALETVFVQYNRDLYLPAWLYGAAITVLFTVVINAIVLRKVKYLKLTDVN